MPEAAAVVVETKSEAKTVIRPDVSAYKKGRSASGTITQHNGDVVATGLNGLNVEETASIASSLTKVDAKDLIAKYSHLNIGQQRMCLGNRIRGAVAKLEKAEAGTGTSAFAALIKPIAAKAQERIAKAEAEAKAKKEAAAKAAAKKAAAKAAKPAVTGSAGTAKAK